MYYLDEIMDRTFDTWENMIQANDYSFWGDNTEIEAKPNDWTSSATATAESTTWEADSDSNTSNWDNSNSNSSDSGSDSSSDSTEWSSGSDSSNDSTEWSSDSDSDSDTEEWSDTTETEKAASASTINEIADATSDFIEDINPFTSDEDQS